MELEYQDRCDMIADKEDNKNSVPSKVITVVDNRSKKISWAVRDTNFGRGVLVQCSSFNVLPRKDVDWVKCINNKKEYYLFTAKGERQCLHQTLKMIVRGVGLKNVLTNLCECLFYYLFMFN